MQLWKLKTEEWWRHPISDRQPQGLGADLVVLMVVNGAWNETEDDERLGQSQLEKLSLFVSVNASKIVKESMPAFRGTSQLWISWVKSSNSHNLTYET